MEAEQRFAGRIRIGGAEVPYRLVFRRRRRRTITFRVDTGPVLVVRAPARESGRSVDDLVSPHAEWILRRIADAQSRPDRPPREYRTGETIQYLGRHYRLDVARAPAGAASCVLRRGRLELSIPMSPDAPAARQTAEAAVLSWFKTRATAKFEERLSVWRPRLDVSPGRLIVTSTRSQWGSCDSRNNIRLCWRVVMAPTDLVDYVVAHELCHVVHKNHGPGFWRKLESAMPDCRRRRERLRVIGPRLTL